jgi:hypothetical protein
MGIDEKRIILNSSLVSKANKTYKTFPPPVALLKC